MADTAVAPLHPLTPLPYRVMATRRLTDDVTTLSLEPLAGTPVRFGPGQFNMLTAFGIGEVAISVSSAPDAPGPLEHTIRDVGAVTHALCSASPGAVVGVRGPFGNDWGVDDMAGSDVVVVAGGIGLAPLRGAVERLVASLGDRRGPSALFVLVGARSPDQVVFADDLARWQEAGADVRVTVDVAEAGWAGRVGVVTTLLPGAAFDPDRTKAIMCGPEIMMRFSIRGLVDRGVPASAIRVSLERNMQCGVGLCGHCQLGPYLLCRDGPIFGYEGALERLLLQRER
ncbi:MAG TPA: FAD/NAD(P)-binding protein [Acidimicrobiales bacterium]|nr:FAD/NAD(P)-binding protein [Acidimicrobiales bacterium]